MKAKDYTNKYTPLFNICDSEEKLKEVMSNLFKEFMEDIDNLKDTRHIITKAGLVSLLNEGSEKWKSLSRLFPNKLSETGFRDFWKSKCPEIAEELR